jgi:hypothetical protein
MIPGTITAKKMSNPTTFTRFIALPENQIEQPDRNQEHPRIMEVLARQTPLHIALIRRLHPRQPLECASYDVDHQIKLIVSPERSPGLRIDLRMQHRVDDTKLGAQLVAGCDDVRRCGWAELCGLLL